MSQEKDAQVKLRRQLDSLLVEHDHMKADLQSKLTELETLRVSHDKSRDHELELKGCLETARAELAGTSLSCNFPFWFSFQRHPHQMCSCFPCLFSGLQRDRRIFVRLFPGSFGGVRERETGVLIPTR